MTSPQVPTVTIAQLPAAPVIVDVREDDEWSAGHIDGAVHIPLASVPDRLAELPQADPLVIICRAGGRSAQATAYLLAQGVSAINLEGGMTAWAAAGRPMVADGDEPPYVG